ncbi:endonuclease/exonuclease/phosphatase family protein [Roseibium sp. FZY0029]|uniref:endonuclease/exonuclease/phosphatase family protein n=1 Tax=Roseibium sp. FZY0029 TaxID=3116647 RepID=UPI002EAE9D8A|nr:endonuclease/exonuclease/phosphatase family protein [Roseibium sp. FZY0029]
MRILLSLFLCVAVVGLSVVTFLALWPTNLWWVRMTDFPRLQYGIGLCAAVIAIVLARRMLGRPWLALAALALAALIFNAVKLIPYIFPEDRHTAAACDPERQFKVMVANVKLENHRADELLRIVRDRDPDLLLALETTEWWDRQLSALEDEMPHAASRITGSHFGMHLLSRLPLEDTEILSPAGQDTPVIRSNISLPTGDEVRFYGIHPRPPHPGQSSVGRDALLMWAALQTAETDGPVVLAGDLNAVPWERTVSRLQRIGGLIDPRRIFGFQATYDAHSWWMAWPLDQVLHTQDLSVTSMVVLPDFGSDHYPVEVSFCYLPTEMSPPEPRPDDLDRARDIIAAATRAVLPTQ